MHKALIGAVVAAGMLAAGPLSAQGGKLVTQGVTDTEILIEGHTDATGSDESNLTLSRNRSGSVANYLEGLSVSPTRFTTMGYGESQPIADNESESGRQANRRVELAIMANDKLKKVAEQKAGN